MKKCLLAFSFFLIFSSIHAVELLHELPEETYIDDIDSIFDDAFDMEEVVQNEDASDSLIVSDSVPTYGLRISGNVDAGIGYGMVFRNWVPDQTGYLNFENYFYLRARPVYAVYFSSDIYTSLISGNPNLALSSMYIDYNMWDKVYISVGKKWLNWTNMRLFYGNTIIGSAGSSTIMGSVNVPLGKINLTFVGMLNGSLPDKSGYIDESYSTDVSLLNVHCAGLFEFVLFGTLVSLQTHQYHPDATWFSNYSAVELKRTIYGVDFYYHADTNLKITKKINHDNFYSFREIGGFYKTWDVENYELGVNVECRHNFDVIDNVHTLEIGEEFGINKLFNNRLGIAVAGYHDVFNKTGYITPGFVIKNVFPNANLDNGLTINYSKGNVYYVLGSKITLSISY